MYKKIIKKILEKYLKIKENIPIVIFKICRNNYYVTLLINDNKRIKEWCLIIQDIKINKKHNKNLNHLHLIHNKNVDTLKVCAENILAGKSYREYITEIKENV